MTNKTAFETADWLNSLLFEILCTSKSRQFMDSDQEALISALTKISRTAIESKLSDYQRESWLFLKSLNLDSFSFGDRLPAIKAIKMFQISNASLGIVFDFQYEGGIEVGLKASLAMNFRDFSAKMKFIPAHFKLIVKLDNNPTPRVSLMFSDIPAYEMNVLMRQQRLNRVGRLLNLLIGNFVKLRLCYPNYLTILFLKHEHNEAKSFLKIASEKQYQSQLRVRIVSVNLSDDLLDSDSESNSKDIILQEENEDYFGDDRNNREGLITLNFNGVTFKTETISLLNCIRFNSIHTFNIYNNPYDQNNSTTNTTTISLHLYQKVSESLKQLGRIEIPYNSIKPGLLDFRKIPFSANSTSTVTLEMFLNHMEEDGEADANWIFWNTSKPKKKTNESQVDRSIDKINWDTIKFIISRLSYDTEESEAEVEEQEDALDEGEKEEIPLFVSHETDSSTNNNNTNDDFMESKDLIQFINLKLNTSIRLLNSRILSIKDTTDLNLSDLQESSCTDPLKILVEKALSVLSALNYELKEYAQRYNLSRPVLSDKIIPENNKRIAYLLAPIIKSFLPTVLQILRELKQEEFESDFRVKRHILERVLLELNQVIELVSASCSDTSFMGSKHLSSPTPSSSSSDSPPSKAQDIQNFDQFSNSIFYAHLGDIPVKMTINELDGISITSFTSTHNQSTPIFDFEGIFYTPKSKITNLTSLLPSKDTETLDLSSTVNANIWEIALLKDHLILITEMGRSPLFPNKIINVSDIQSVELVKEQGAFNLGFNADFQTQTVNSNTNKDKVAMLNSKNGLLKLKFITQNGDLDGIDLIGESRSCDQWFYMISSKLTLRKDIKIPWKDIDKCWLLPLNIPSLSFPYTLAISSSSNAFITILSNFFADTDLHGAYCFVKTILSKRQTTKSLLDINNFASSRRSLLSTTNTNTSSNSSGSSISRSHSQYSININSSTSSLNWSSASFTSLSSASRDPFENKNLYEKLTMTTMNTDTVTSSSDQQMIPNWVGMLVENSNLFFKCKTDSNISQDPEGLGTLAIGPEYICFYNSTRDGYETFHLIIPRDIIKDIKKITNWFNIPIDICITFKLSSSVNSTIKDPVYFNNFAKREELELAFEALLGY